MVEGWKKEKNHPNFKYLIMKSKSYFILILLAILIVVAVYNDEEGLTLILVVIGIIVLYYILKVKGKSLNQIDYKGNSVDKTLKSSVDLINSNISKIEKITQKTISKSYITGCSWILINEKDDTILYTFRTNEELLVTKNGIVERETYELIVDSNSILITKNGITEQLDIVNIKDDFLFLRKLTNYEILSFANHTKYRNVVKNELNTLVRKINYGL